MITRWKMASLCFCVALIASALAMPLVRAQEKNTKTEDDDSQLDAYVTFAAVGLKVRPPQGFGKEKSFSGFASEVDKASILVTRLPVPMEAASESFTPEVLASRGWTLRGRRMINLPEQPALLISCEHPLSGTTFEKWIVLIGDAKQSWMISASFPTTAPEAIKSKLTAALTTTVITDTSLDLRSLLPFTAKGPKSLKLVEKRYNMLMYTQTGQDEMGDDPALMVLGIQSKRPPPEERRQVAESVFKKLDVEIVVDSVKEIVIDNMPGLEFHGHPNVKDLEAPVKLYYVVLFDENLLIFVMSQSVEAKAKQFLPEFKETAENVRRRTTPK
jgi:hypothetical protein